MNPNAIKAGALAVLALLFILAVLDVAWPEGEVDDISNERLSLTLFGSDNWSGYALVVFMIGLLLVVAILGGVFLAKGESEEEEKL